MKNKLIWIIVIIIILVIIGFFIFNKNLNDNGTDNNQQSEQVDTSDINAMSDNQLIDTEYVSEDDVDLGEVV